MRTFTQDDFLVELSQLERDAVRKVQRDMSALNGGELWGEDPTVELGLDRHGDRRMPKVA